MIEQNKLNYQGVHPDQHEQQTRYASEHDEFLANLAAARFLGRPIPKEVSGVTRAAVD